MLKTRDLVSNKRICLQGAYKKSLPPGSLHSGRETENKHVQKVGTGLLYDSTYEVQKQEGN